MADSPSGQERTEQASAKRLAEAREKGQIPRSRDLATTLLVLTSGMCLWLTGDGVGEALARIMRDSFTVDRAMLGETSTMVRALNASVTQGLASLAPFFVVTIVASVLGSLALGGWSLSVDPLSFKWERIDPFRGIGRLLSVKSLVELGKALAKFVLLLGFGLAALYHEFDAIVNLAHVGLESSLAQSFWLCFKAFLVVGAGTALIALVDVPFQLWDHARNLRMTRQELREELKESEGSPEVKARVRALQQELARRRMMEEVPKADVVITNPTHFAVALRFDAATMAAPRVVAKGVDLMAFRIRDAARTHGVAVVSAPPLARSIYHTTKLDREIPVGLYKAVAQVLAYVFQLRARTAASAAPVLPAELPIPPELQYD